MDSDQRATLILLSLLGVEIEKYSSQAATWRALKDAGLGHLTSNEITVTQFWDEIELELKRRSPLYFEPLS